MNVGTIVVSVNNWFHFVVLSFIAIQLYLFTLLEAHRRHLVFILIL